MNVDTIPSHTRAKSLGDSSGSNMAKPVSPTDARVRAAKNNTNTKYDAGTGPGWRNVAFKELFPRGDLGKIPDPAVFTDFSRGQLGADVAVILQHASREPEQRRIETSRKTP
jgi:hypothetical protein